jgi:hypothetical protein
MSALAALWITMHRIAPFDIPESARTSEEALVAESARRVAAGGTPLERMVAPSLYFDGAGEVFVQLTQGKLVLRTVSMLGELGDTITSNVANQIVDRRNGVIFVDRAALNAAMKALAADSPNGQRRARVIAYLCRLPLNSKYAVLTDTLAQRFVAPGPATSLSTWRDAFHLEGVGDFELLVRLAQRAASGETPVIPDAISRLRSYGNSCAFSLFKGRSESIAAYKSITRHGDLWAAVEHTDPILQAHYLRSGDTIAAMPFKMLGGLVEARVSTPFKIRPGSSVLVWKDGRGLPATMVELGFDPETESLTARFTTPATGKRRHNGYDMLFDALGYRGHGTGETFYVTTEPFAGSETPGGKHNMHGSWSAGRSVTRELPLFVSLAAAAAPQAVSRREK